jgi:hypothetical protein
VALVHLQQEVATCHLHHASFAAMHAVAMLHQGVEPSVQVGQAMAVLEEMMDQPTLVWLPSMLDLQYGEEEEEVVQRTAVCPQTVASPHHHTHFLVLLQVEQHPLVELLAEAWAVSVHFCHDVQYVQQADQQRCPC